MISAVTTAQLTITKQKSAIGSAMLNGNGVSLCSNPTRWYSTQPGIVCTNLQILPWHTYTVPMTMSFVINSFIIHSLQLWYLQGLYSNFCVQNFSSNFGLSTAYTMKSNGEELSWFWMTLKTRALEISVGNLKRKENNWILLTSAEWFQTWDLKCDWRKLLLTNTQYRLWDDCQENKAYVRSSMAHDIFK